MRAIDGGWVSPALVYSTGKGDVVRLAAPVGTGLVLDDDSDADLLLLAGGTGLAPLRALVEQLDGRRQRRNVDLYVGAQTEAELYDLHALRRLQERNRWLSVVPVVERGSSPGLAIGEPAQVALGHRRWQGAQVYVCGSPDMVQSSLQALASAGIDTRAVRRETYSYNGHVDHVAERKGTVMTAPSEVERLDVERGAGGALVQRLTPDGVRRIQFTRSPIGRRGYNEMDVEHFRARVVHEIGQASAEKAAMRQELERQRDEVQRLRDYFRRNRVDVDAPGGPHSPAAARADQRQHRVRPGGERDEPGSAGGRPAHRAGRGLRAPARRQRPAAVRGHPAPGPRAGARRPRPRPAGSSRRVPRPSEPAPERSQEHTSEMQYLQSRLAYMRTFAQVTQVQLRSILDALRQELDQLTDLPNGPDAITPALPQRR